MEAVTHVERLEAHHQQAVETLLAQNIEVNLFLIGFLGQHGMDRAIWFGAVESGYLHGVALLVPGRLVVPWCPVLAHAVLIGEHIRTRYRPCMMVGPREACDAVWSGWAWDHTPDRSYDQRLYVCRRIVGESSAVRLATLEESAAVARNAGEMEEEDLGRNPQDLDAQAHLRVVQDRISSGRTWVMSHGKDIVFQINLGTQSDLGCQIGGTWVPPRHRGNGYATRGVRALTNHLLARHGFVSLHVNERNAPAVRVYEKCGFSRAAPYRLITVKL